MNSRVARLLTRLYPPAWRARYAAEFQTFLEARCVSFASVLNVIGRAVMEHFLEDWRYAPVLLVFLFSAEGAQYFAGAHGLAGALLQHPALALAWLALEGAALAVTIRAVSIVVPPMWEIAGKRFIGIFFLGAAAWAALEILPWRLVSGRLWAALAFLDSLAGIAAMAALCGFGSRFLSRLREWELAREDLESLGLKESMMWGPEKLEWLRLSTSILGCAIFVAQENRALHLLAPAEFHSWAILAASSVLAYRDEVFRPWGTQ